MMDYFFERCAAPGVALTAVGQLVQDLRSLYAATCPEVAELRCVQLGDCVFLLRPSLQRARRAAPPPLFLRLDGDDALVSVFPSAAAPPGRVLTRASQRTGPPLADEADTKACHEAWGAHARPAKI